MKQVAGHQRKKNRQWKWLKGLGPGIITGASDDDPSGIATYSQAGAQFGFTTLWTALVSFPMMAAIQEMCARIGIVTSRGLTVTLREHYPKWVLYLMLLLGFPAITLNIGADLQSMGAVAHMLYPAIPENIYCFLLTVLLMLIIIRFPYQRIANILKWLCLSLLLYVIVPFLVTKDWGTVLRHTLLPSLQFNKTYLAIFVGILGTTISPYLFFWQATMEAEDMANHKKKIIVNKRVLDDMKKDVNIGMAFSNGVMFFIILTTAAVLFPAGITQIDTVDQAALALKPLAGNLTYLIFAMGVLGTGLLAIPVLAGSQSYMLAETFGWDAGLDKKFPQARGFYVSIIVSLLLGLSLNFAGITPIQALLYTAILYGLTAPVLIAIILHIANNKSIMGTHTNSIYSNIMGAVTLVMMTGAAVALLYFQFT